MKKLLLIFLLFCFAKQGSSWVGPGENEWLQQNAQSIFGGPYIWKNVSDEATQTAAAIEYLHKILPQTRLSNSSLRKDLYKISPAGVHITFTQAFFGTAIYGTTVKINISKSGKVTSVLHKTVSTSGWQNAAFHVDLNSIQNIIGGYEISVTEPVWFLQSAKNEPVAATRIEYGKRDGGLHMEAIFGRENNLLYSISKTRYFDEHDTTAMAFVFNPDPLTSAGKPYGAPYVDADDSGLFVLDFERFPKEIITKFRNDTFYLEGKYARIVELSKPVTPQTTSTEAIFNYSRSQPGFEDVNVVYHIQNYQRQVKNLGFDTLGNFALPIDAHALNGDDNSQFDFFGNDLKLFFGTGGIDDAEDADVIVHEYSHYLSYDAAGDNAYGAERLALEEGLADYFACSYSKAISTYNWQKVYSWDGNSTWNGRSCASNKHYPENFLGNRWKDGELWSSPLMHIQAEIGRDKTDKLMLLLLYNTAKYMTLSDAARMFLQADTILFEAQHARIAALAFINNGLLPKDFLAVSKEKNTIMDVKLNPFYFGTHGLIYIDLAQAENCSVEMFDALGRKVFFQPATYGNNLKIYAPQLTKGVYLLRLNTGKKQQSFKLIKEQ